MIPIAYYLINRKLEIKKLNIPSGKKIFHSYASLPEGNMRVRQASGTLPATTYKVVTPYKWVYPTKYTKW